MPKDKKSSRKQAATEVTRSFQAHQTLDELYAFGKSLRDQCPRQSHAAWLPPHDRPDPLALMEESDRGRVPHLIPIRHGRMLQSPFTFYRGAALNMAADLSRTPTTGLRVQACGDCHLSNFGSFATPERRVIFDINDLDETLPAPWEWDVKRLAASFVLASRNNRFSEDSTREAALSCVRSYREHMAEYSTMPVLDVWYASIDVESLIPTIADDDARRRYQKRLAKARERSVLEHEFPELVTNEGLSPVIKDDPPLIYHLGEEGQNQFSEIMQRGFAQYRESLHEERRVLIDRYMVRDIAMKVVGVGSVGTVCGIMLLMASEHDPLFLQIKQAGRSVLEDYTDKSVHAHNGQRIVHGYRMMQSASDIFLGWAEGAEGRQFYIRQLRDMKIKPMVEVFTPSVMNQYARLCGWTLARAHARSGEPAKISGYLGASDKFDEAVADFAVTYADQTERDYDVLTAAAREGKLDVYIEDD